MAERTAEIPSRWARDYVRRREGILSILWIWVCMGGLRFYIGGYGAYWLSLPEPWEGGDGSCLMGPVKAVAPRAVKNAIKMGG